MNTILLRQQNTFLTVPDSFQSFLVQGAEFTATEEYPIIPEEFVAKAIPKKLMPFSKAITYKGDLSDTYIVFYSPDETFERVRRNPHRYVAFFRRTAGVFGLDFSIHSDMPVIKQKSQMNDNLALTFYYGSCGIPVIPNLRCGIDELLPEFLSAIPHNNIVAIGTHGFAHRMQEQCEWYCFIENFLDVLHPSGVVVYGSLRSHMFDSLKEKANFFFYDPWITERAKEVKKNGH